MKKTLLTLTLAAVSCVAMADGTPSTYTYGQDAWDTKNNTLALADVVSYNSTEAWSVTGSITIANPGNGNTCGGWKKIDR